MPPEQFQEQPQTVQYQTYEQPKKGLPIGKIAVVAGVFFLLLAIQWVYGNGFVEVTVDSGSNENVTYSFTSDPNDLPIEAVSSSKKYKKIMPKGTYEVLVRQGDKSYFASVDSKGLFGTTKISAKLSSERGRRYVGNQPKTCMYWLGSSMISYDCDGTLSSLVTHKPATADLPTFAQPNPYPTDDIFQGLINTKEGDLVFIYEAVEAGHESFEPTNNGHTPHVGFILKNGLNFQYENRTALTDFTETDRITVKPYKEGFLAYSKWFEKMFYYPSLSSKAESITTPVPTNNVLVPYDIATSNSSFAIAFNENGSSSDTRQDSVVMVQTDGKNREYKFTRTFETIRLCGNSKLCGVSDNVLYVYDVSGKKADLVYTVTDVITVENFRGGLVVVRGREVFNLDVEKREGNQQYSFGDDYKYCGIQPVKDTYTLCISSLVNNREQRSMLYIEQGQESDGIDKKVARVMKVKEVTAISVYNNQIFVSPDGGEMVFVPAIHGFDYDPAKLKQAKDAANKAVDDSGIDKTKYQIKYTL